MLILAIDLINNAYAACPYDAAHIEGTVELPPSLWRILRAIVYGGYEAKKASSFIDWEIFKTVVTALAGGKVSYYIPSNSYVQLNTYRKDRNDLPSLYKSGKLLCSGELRFNPQERTIYLFWQVELNEAQIDTLKTAIAYCGYLGRSESLADWQVVTDVDVRPNCYPDDKGLQKVLVPSDEFVFDHLLKNPRQIHDLERRQHIPGATYISYTLKDKLRPERESKNTGVNNYARISLTAKFPLLETDTLYLADKIHKALVSVKGDQCPSANFTGIDFSLAHRQDNYLRSNDHVYLVPVIQNGMITDFELYCNHCFSQDEENQLERLRTLYTKTGEITVRLCALGNHTRYKPKARTWKSLTPMFLPRIPATRRNKPRMLASSRFQKDGPEHQALKLLLHLPQFEHFKNNSEINYVPSDRGLEQWIDNSLFCIAKANIFQQWWKWQCDRPHGKKAIKQGYSVELNFLRSQTAPIAIGYSAHFGLGTFGSCAEG